MLFIYLVLFIIFPFFCLILFIIQAPSLASLLFVFFFIKHKEPFPHPPFYSFSSSSLHFLFFFPLSLLFFSILLFFFFLFLFRFLFLCLSFSHPTIFLTTAGKIFRNASPPPQPPPPPPFIENVTPRNLYRYKLGKIIMTGICIGISYGK